jgi:hypothetical protein
MNVNITESKKTKTGNTQFWRRIYIKLLTEDPRPWNDMSDAERKLQMSAIEDLVAAGYMSGKVNKDTTGTPCNAAIHGPTLAGRIFAEEQQEILAKKSVWGQIKSGAGFAFGWVFGWLGGFISALIIWYISRVYPTH